MKKLSLLALAALAAAAPLSAMADGTVDVRYCNDVYTYQGCGSAADYELYIEVPADLATRLAGNKVTKLFYSAYIFSGDVKGEIFVDEGSNTMSSTEVSLVNNYSKPDEEYTAYEFAEPYTIKAGVAFYAGVRLHGTEKDYPVSVATNLNGYSGYVNYKPVGATSWSTNTAKGLGLNNLCLYIQTEGPVTELENYFQLGTPVPVFTLPMVEQGSPIYFQVPVTNFGTNAITSVDYSFTPANGEAIEETAQVLVTDLREEVNVLVATPAVTEVGRATNRVVLNKVNGVELGTPSRVNLPAIVMPKDAGFTQRVLVEEGTGLWCGFCPRGIVGMDYMEENYPETFIGIGVHYNDVLEAPTYSTIINNYFKNYGFPSAIVNRDSRYLMDPNIEDLEAAYNRFAEGKSICDVAVSVDEITPEKYVATATVRFALDFDNANFRLAFITLEDGIKGQQTNYFSATDASNPYRGIVSLNDYWNKQPYKVDWTYNNTARGIFLPRGISGSVPRVIEAGKDYTFSYDQISVANITAGAPTKLVAAVIDYNTGVIVNAARISVVEAGINDVELGNADAASPVEYFNLQGRRVENPQGGIFIRRQGDKSVKVVL